MRRWIGIGMMVVGLGAPIVFVVVGPQTYVWWLHFAIPGLALVSVVQLVGALTLMESKPAKRYPAPQEWYDE